MAQTQIPKPMAKVFSALHRGVYKLSGGRVGSSLGDASVGLLTTTGRKSGKSRTMPLILTEHGEGWAVIASYSGHDVHPAWYLNLSADPTATVRMGKDDFDVRARDTEGDERQEIWDRMVSAYGDYEAYAEVTDRVIPVVALERV